MHSDEYSCHSEQTLKLGCGNKNHNRNIMFEFEHKTHHKFYHTILAFFESSAATVSGKIVCFFHSIHIVFV